VKGALVSIAWIMRGSCVDHAWITDGSSFVAPLRGLLHSLWRQTGREVSQPEMTEVLAAPKKIDRAVNGLRLIYDWLAGHSKDGKSLSEYIPT
jgi:hypothetical protein